MGLRTVTVKTETLDETIETPIEANLSDFAPATPHRVADGYHHAIHPETGLEAVWTTGEVVPEWAWPENQPEAAATEDDGSTA